MKKVEEKYWFQKFAETYKEMPLGSVNFGDSPDVIFTSLERKTIGIEFTEWIYDERLMETSEFKILFNQKVVAVLDKIMPFRFYLDIDLDSTYKFKKNKLDTVVNQVVQFCINEFLWLGCDESRSVEHLEVDWKSSNHFLRKHFRDNGYRKLPKGVTRINMDRNDYLEESFHPEFKGGVVPDFTYESLNYILAKKNKAVVNYTACDQQWLVIVEGSDFCSYVNNVRIESKFETSFEKVFMLRALGPEIIVIK